jgi:integrase
MTSRIRKSRGTVEQRTQTWYLRITRHVQQEGTNDLIKRRVRIELGSATELRSEAAARRAADAWLSRNAPEQLADGNSIGFAKFAEQFLSERASLFRRSTQRNFTTVIRKQLIPELGNLPLWRVGPAEIRAAFARRRAAGLAHTSLMHIRAVLLQLLRQARADGLDAQQIDTTLVRLPREDAAEREQRHISTEELEQILSAAVMPYRALYAVMGLAGLRISEAVGLAWSHLDLDTTAPLVRVRQGASGGELLQLKTKTSRADLPLDPRLAEMLRDYRAIWQPNDAGLLFAGRSGKPRLEGDIRRRHWNPLLKRLGLPHAGFHALRHGLPRRLFANGASAAVVQKLMRHGSLQMTERYTHSTAEDLRAAINRNQRSSSQQSGPTVTQLPHAVQENKPLCERPET